jgi:hypothetical protein
VEFGHYTSVLHEIFLLLISLPVLMLFEISLDVHRAIVMAKMASHNQCTLHHTVVVLDEHLRRAKLILAVLP